MNKMIFCTVSVMMAMGCAKESTVSNTRSPSNQSASTSLPAYSASTDGSVVPDSVQVRPDDNFDKMGHATANGARWSYNKLKGVYEWVTNDENKERANQAWETTKKAAVKAADVIDDAAHKALDEAKK